MSDPAAPAAGAVSASFSSRLFAFVADAVLLTIVLYLASIVLAAVRGPVVSFHLSPAGATQVTVDQGRALAVAIASAALGAAYFVGAWLAWSATPAQRPLGIRVRRTGGGPLTPGQAAARWLLLMGPLALGPWLAFALPGLRVLLDLATLGWYLVLVVTTLRSPTRQGLHDRLAGTVVTSEARLARPSPA